MRRGTSVSGTGFGSTVEKRRPIYVDDLEGGAGTTTGGGSLSSALPGASLPPPPPHVGTSTPPHSYGRSAGGGGGGTASTSYYTQPYHRSSSSSSSFQQDTASDGTLLVNSNDDHDDDYDPLRKPGSSGRRKRHHHHHHHGSGANALMNRLMYPSPGSSSSSVRIYMVLLFVATAIAFPFLSTEVGILAIVYSAILFGFLVTIELSRSVLKCDDGTPEMRAVSDPIRQGAEGFLKVQYTAIAKFAVPLSGLIWLSYQFRPDPHTHSDGGGGPKGVAILGNTVLGLVASLGFVCGAVCSAVSGYVSMWVAAQSNIRVASAGRRSYGEALVVCFRGGAFSAVLNLTLCIAGVTTLYTLLYVALTTSNVLSGSAGNMLKGTDIPMLLVGYGFGASFVALFMQLGGGIYTKAADVGADLVGKVEQSIPEDDPRNPAVIADLVGDMVGDCVGSSADVFESVAAEIIGAMILVRTSLFNCVCALCLAFEPILNVVSRTPAGIDPRQRVQHEPQARLQVRVLSVDCARDGHCRVERRRCLGERHERFRQCRPHAGIAARL
jgi:Inorganic H+ pyrophosphatase